MQSNDTVRVSVNQGMCIGASTCELLEPDVFTIDDDTSLATVVGEGRLSPERARITIERCPSGAISIIEE